VSLTAEPATVTAGQAVTLTWSSTDAGGCEASGGWSGARPTTGVEVSAPLEVVGGVAFTLTCTGDGGQAAQTVGIIVEAPQPPPPPPPPPPAPTVSLSAEPATLVSGESATLSWSATDADTCEASGGWSGARPAVGQESTGVLSAVGTVTFGLTCTGPGGEASASAVVSVQESQPPPPPPPPPAPTVSLSAEPASVLVGQEAQLAWSSTDADTCEASGGWSGTRPAAGQESTGVLSAVGTVTFGLTCTGPGGQASSAVVVSVEEPPPPPAPTVSLSAEPATLVSGESTTLSWSATDADTCEASGAWSGERPTSGAETVGPLVEVQVLSFAVTCTGAGGALTATVDVTVTPPPPPSVWLAASPASVVVGGATTLVWSASGADACEAGGAWSGSRTSSGREAVTLTAEGQQPFVLTCTGPGGSSSASQLVTVVPSQPSCSVADASGCVAGTDIVVTDAGWTCSRPLSAYGPLPIRVTVAATRAYSGTGATLTTGCAGDADPSTIDLILYVQGDGLSFGPTEDGVKTKLQAGYTGSIQLTGRVDCGPRGGALHQDGVQAQGGRDISFVDFVVGDHAGGRSTCQGAGGAFFYSGANGYSAQMHHVVRGRYIACVKGLGAGSSGTGTVTDAVFRSGRTDGTDPTCIGLNAPATCTATTAISWTNVLCEKWARRSATWQRDN
jgi:hypothetical protein